MSNLVVAKFFTVQASMSKLLRSSPRRSFPFSSFARNPQTFSPRMYPVWHGLSALVPIYGWLRFHAHCTAVNYVIESGGGTAMVRPGSAVLGVIAGGAAGGASWSELQISK